MDRPTCIEPGCHNLAKKGHLSVKDGRRLYNKRCQGCAYEERGLPRSNSYKYKKPYLLYKGYVCIKCGFVPEHICQLDVDHIDGNHTNNDVSNLQTLCANCHRLKTHLNGDYKVKTIELIHNTMD